MPRTMRTRTNARLVVLGVGAVAEPVHAQRWQIQEQKNYRRELIIRSARDGKVPDFQHRQ